MPFTFAHPAAALPLRRVGLPVAALVVGTMVPDVPLFVPVGPRYQVTHSWAGVVTAMGVGVLALLAVAGGWHLVMTIQPSRKP